MFSPILSHGSHASSGCPAVCATRVVSVLRSGNGPGREVAARIFAAAVIHLLVMVCYRRWVTAKAASTTATTPAMIVTTTEWVAR